MESKPTPEENKEYAEIKTTGYVIKPKKSISAWIYFNTEMVAKLKVEKAMDQKEAFTKSA